MPRTHAHGQRPRRGEPDEGARRDRAAAHPLLRLQASVGNRATAHVASGIQRGGLLDWFTDAFAELQGGGGGRPSASSMLSAYRRVDYANHSTSESAIDEIATTHPEIADVFRRRGFTNSCATRLSVALIDAGQSIGSPARRVDGGHRWDPGAIKLHGALRNMWGKPDLARGSVPSLADLKAKLAGGKIAVFAGSGHSGIVTATYHDPYVAGYLDRVAFWILD